MRRGFTLMETMLATGIASIVVLACLALMFAMNRTDRMMDVRAQQRSDLGRIRTVMSRALSSLLLSDEPMNTGNPAQDDDAIFDGKPMPASNNRAGNRSGASGTPAATPVADKAGDDKSGTSGKNTGEGAAGDERNADGTERTSKGGKVIAPPPPPRIILGVDSRVDDVMRFRATPELPEVQAGVQRLEVVLHRSPVPAAKIDPLDMPLPPRSSHQRSRAAREASEANSGEEAGDNPAPLVDASTGEEVATPDEEAALPVRAIRGAFELRPQPPAGYRLPGIPTVPAASDDRSFQRTGLWELWWIPLLPPGATEQSVTRNEALFAGTQQPYYIAGNLKYARWTVFFRREKRPDLVSTWRSDLPAYIEFQVETAAGLQANWMFEVDWAEGPEIAKRPEDKAKAATRNANNEGGTGGTGNGEATTGRPRVNRPAVSSGGGRPLPRPSSRGGKSGAASGGGDK